MEQWWQPALRDVFAGRRVVIAGAVPAAWHEHVEHLRTAGATDIMILATGGAGVGAGPDVTTHVVEPPVGLSMMERVRHDTRALTNPSAEVRDTIDRFDPTGEAIVCGGFLNEAPTLAGRPILATRRPEWVRFEDKTVVDEFWDRAGVERRPARVIPLDEVTWAATRDLDEGAGTVWAADSRDGYHGGGDATRWVRDEADADRVRSELAARCDRVRVMPFLDGISCSIHGLVDDDGVAVLRPVELVTLRRGTRLVYAGCATFWDPPEAVRAAMRSLCRRAGLRLRDEIEFRGTFTVDGVVRADGFWPTELNPRFGAGLNVIARATGEIPILLVHDLIVAGRSSSWSTVDLEAYLVEHADAHRSGGTWRVMDGAAPAIEDRPATATNGDWRWSGDGDRVDGRVSAGTGFVRCAFDADSTPTGPSVAPRAAAFWNFVEPELDIGWGGLTAPADPFHREPGAPTRVGRP